MSCRKKPSPRLLSRLIDCDTDSGRMFWKDRPVWMFRGDIGVRARTEKLWKTRWEGKPTFTTPHCQGYLMGKIFGQGYLAHSVVWTLHHGEWPKIYIDHINGVRTDNRISNLREVDHFEHAKNMGISRANKSGVTGVHWEVRRKKWVAAIYTNGKTKRLGEFDTVSQAAKARRAAEKKFGFHPNHGRANSVPRS